MGLIFKKGSESGSGFMIADAREARRYCADNEQKGSNKALAKSYQPQIWAKRICSLIEPESYLVFLGILKRKNTASCLRTSKKCFSLGTEEDYIQAIE
jgi:hypothetical protein